MIRALCVLAMVLTLSGCQWMRPATEAAIEPELVENPDVVERDLSKPYRSKDGRP